MATQQPRRRHSPQPRLRTAFVLIVWAVLGWTVDARAGCVPKDLAIAVDAGHGPKSPGAASATGAAEYDFNIRLARQVATALERAGFARAFLLDPIGVGLPPAARAARANAARAGLLISIHHDSVQPQFLEPWSVNGTPRRFCDRFAGYSIFYSGKNAKAAASLSLARLIGQELRSAGLTFTSHHAADIPGERRVLVDDAVGVYRYDGLAVLGVADMPAVLLEAGVIVNRREEAELAGAARQHRTAVAVAGAVAAWCAGRRP
jgi:N-acetylmuramoyl-L-alanine amidase